MIHLDLRSTLKGADNMHEKFKENSVYQLVHDVKKSVVFLGKLVGNIHYLVFMTIDGTNESTSREIFEALIKNGYLNEQGMILSKYKPYKKGFRLELNEKFNKYEKDIVRILDRALRPEFYATGFLIKVQDIFHLVTAKHVVFDIKTEKMLDDELQVFFNLKEGNYSKRSIESIKEMDIKRIFHEDKNVDVALIPFAIDIKKDDIKIILDKMFYPINEIMELYEVLFLSYQPGIEAEKRVSPIIRKGTVSKINENRTFYIDGAAFPGNSGSPVILQFAPIAIDKDGKPYFINIRKNLGIRLLGIIGEYLPYREVAISTQTQRPRIIFEENTGLSKVWSTDYINEIIESAAFKEQLRKVKDIIQQSKESQ